MGDDVEELVEAFERELAREVHRVVSSAELDTTAYCVALNYGDDPCRGLIPVVGVGFLRAGESIAPPVGTVAPEEEHRWNPAEFSTLGDPALQPRSPTLADLDRRLSDACLNGAEVGVRALCNRVAARLNRLDWAPLQTSEQFLVYAVDDDLVDLDENLSLARAAKRA